MTDYRQDENLRLMVISSIIQTQQIHFEPILEHYRKEMAPLKLKLEALGAGKQHYYIITLLRNYVIMLCMSDAQ